MVLQVSRFPCGTDRAGGSRRWPRPPRRRISPGCRSWTTCCRSPRSAGPGTRCRRRGRPSGSSPPARRGCGSAPSCRRCRCARPGWSRRRSPPSTCSRADGRSAASAPAGSSASTLASGSRSLPRPSEWTRWRRVSRPSARRCSTRCSPAGATRATGRVASRASPSSTPRSPRRAPARTHVRGRVRRPAARRDGDAAARPLPPVGRRGRLDGVRRRGRPRRPGRPRAPGAPRRGRAVSPGQPSPSSITDRTLPAGSVNQAMSGPPPRKTPLASVSFGEPS